MDVMCQGACAYEYFGAGALNAIMRVEIASSGKPTSLLGNGWTGGLR
jgi:hypothetical protein